MNYLYPVSPYIQATMGQAMQAMMIGSPLPQNCCVFTVFTKPMSSMFPQPTLNYVSGRGETMYSQPPSFYSQLYPPHIGLVQNNQQPTTLVPYSNYHSNGFNQNYHYPMLPYIDYKNQFKKKTPHDKAYHLQPHSNVYNSSSFDTDMNNLSWSRLFGHHHSKQQKLNSNTLNYEQKIALSKNQQALSTNSFSSSSSSTPSDETIRRVNVSSKPQPAVSFLKQQPKGGLPFKYSSELIPRMGRQQQQSNKKPLKIKVDDIFIIKKGQQSEISLQQ